ncbi:MAG: site-specific integrase [Cocleimonas sp.]|nr:site-specific integrase [Cocleimonas sp.]
MATIVKTPAGNWKALIRIKGYPPSSQTFRVKRDATNWARTTEDEIVRGIYIPRNNSEKTTITNALGRYLKEVTPTKKPTTQKLEANKAKVIRKHLGSYTLASLNAEKITKFRDQRLSLGLSSTTVRLELALLSHLYTIAIKEWGMGLQANPVLNVRKPKQSKGRDRRLEGNEEQELLATCEAYSNPMLAWIVKLALYTGMRHSEIVNLKHSSVNLDKRTLFLSDTKNGESRTVPLSNKAIGVIREVLNHPIRPIDTNLLFFGEPGRDGLRRPYVTSKIWTEARKKAGIEGLRFHDLRHEATSRFVEAGLSDLEVSSITGHKSMQMLKRYTHLRTENLSDKIADI